MIKKKVLENQGVDVNIDDLEDEVWVRNEDGEFVKLEVEDDADYDPA